MKNLSKASLFALLCSALLFITILTQKGSNKEVTFVILSTNDMHANIDGYPRAAEAIKQCRDTVDILLVDAGDRWTGNAYVDRVEHYTPVYEFMNGVKYDLGIYGNHEFDKGSAYLIEADRQATFEMLCANIKSNIPTFPQPLAHYTLEIEGKKITFVGTVGNYDGDGHPSGKSESYEGLTFSDPIITAGEYSHLRSECDMLILVSHSGLERDIEFAESEHSQGYDLIIGGHSHDTANQVNNNKLITQSGSRLKNIGATTVTIAKDGSISLSYRDVPLSDYEPEPQMQAMVDKYLANPELSAKIGEAGAHFNSAALVNMFAETIRKRVNANIGIYHGGGVRLEEIPAGDLSISTVLNIEPFNSRIATASMTLAQLKGLVMTKFNDPQNVGESHHIDITMTTPYTVVTDENGDAIDVIFPRLSESRLYNVAMGDYIFKTYKGLKMSNGVITDILITDVLESYIRKSTSILPDSTEYQDIASSTPETQE